MEYTKESIRSQLLQSTMSIEFIKTDGTVRKMLCTLQESIVLPYEKKTDRVKPEHNSIISVWDIENEGWRSFVFERILNAVVVKDPVNV
jgi:hypothetical protein